MEGRKEKEPNCLQDPTPSFPFGMQRQLVGARAIPKKVAGWPVDLIVRPLARPPSENKSSLLHYTHPIIRLCC